MGECLSRKQPNTTNSQIRSALRQLFLRSRERAAAIKRDDYTCQICGRKQSRAKGKEVFVECHHVGDICNWQALFNAVREYLLCHPDNLVTLCKECHKKSHEAEI